jgi:hypothetical protein
MPIPLQTKLSIFEARNEYYSNWHLFARRWQHAQGLHLALTSIRPALATRSGLRLALASIRPTLATRSGAAPYAVNFSGLLNGAPSATSTLVRHIPIRRQHCLRQAFDDDIACSKHSTTTLPAASIRQRHHLQQAFDNIITMIQPPCDSTDHDMQELHLVPSHPTCKTMTSRQD